MCYEEGKGRKGRGLTGNVPLIALKKHSEQREKENEKQNYESTAAKNRVYNHHEGNDYEKHENKYEGKMNNNFVTIPHHHVNPHKERHQNYYYVQNTKTLTFANVKQGNRTKETHQEQSSFLALAN